MPTMTRNLSHDAVLGCLMKQFIFLASCDHYVLLSPRILWNGSKWSRGFYWQQGIVRICSMWLTSVICFNAQRFRTCGWSRSTYCGIFCRTMTTTTRTTLLRRVYVMMSSGLWGSRDSCHLRSLSKTSDS